MRRVSFYPSKLPRSIICALLVAQLLLTYFYISCYTSKCNSDKSSYTYTQRASAHERPGYIQNGRLIFVDIKEASSGLDQDAIEECIRSRTDPKFTVCLHPKSKDMFISQDLKQSGMWEWKLHERMRTELERCPDCMYIDVGANIGPHTLYAMIMGRDVISIEPSQVNLNLLIQSAMINMMDSPQSREPSGTFTLLANAVSDTHKDIVMVNPNKRNQGYAVIRKIEEKSDENAQHEQKRARS